MEGNWLLSTSTLFNTKTSRLDSQKKVAKEMGVAIEHMTNVLEQFGVDLQLKKNRTKERIDQLEISFVKAFED